jgi:hypothetical protein
LAVNQVDRQSEAYRNASEADWAGVDLSQCVVYEDGDPQPIATPGEWEAAGWDAGRDPAAPDDESVADAYDHLED